MDNKLETIEVNLDKVTKEEWLIFFKLIIRKKFDPASASIMDEATTKNIKKKLWEATRNEILLDAVKGIIAEGEKSERQSNTETPSGEVKESSEIPLGSGPEQGT